MRRASGSVEESRIWLAEHGEAFRAETTEALFDGNDVALFWAARVLAMLDSLEAFAVENERLRSSLATARDFITGHPAVSGEWPLLVSVIDSALGRGGESVRSESDG